MAQKDIDVQANGTHASAPSPAEGFEVLLITGMSGAGRSHAADSIEDMGWYVVDNMPPKLLVPLVDMMTTGSNIHKLAAVVDVRSRDYFDDLSGGMVHLNGPQALAYCRNRYIGTDFGRTERQRKVLTEVIHKLPKGVLTNPKGLIDGLMPNLTTNLTQTECYRLSLMAPKILTYDIIQNSIPIEGTYKDATHRKMSVLEVDFEANKKFLQENLYGTGDSTATAASEN